MDKIVGLLILISLLVIGIYFLHVGKIGSKGFITYVSIVLVVGLAFHLSDRLKELDVTKLRIVLGELKETRQDIEKEVTLLMETIAESYVYSAVETGRFTDADLNKQMIKKRNRAVDLFKKAGRNETEIAERVERINFLIASDLMNEVLQQSWQHIMKTRPNDAQQISKAFHEGFWALKGESITEQTVTRMEQYLSEHKVPSDVYKATRDELLYFLKSKELK